MAPSIRWFAPLARHSIFLRRPTNPAVRQSFQQKSITVFTKPQHLRQSFLQRSAQRSIRSSSYSTVVVQNTSRSRGRRFVSFLFIASTSFLIGGYVAFTRAPPFLSPLIMGSIPTDVETLDYEPPDEFTREVDYHIRNCEIAQSLRANPDFTESRPFEKLPYEIKQHNLTAGTLVGNSMIAVPPLFFNEKGGKSMVCIFYAGPDLSGHPGMIHGGFLATMLDEGLARCAFPAMPNKVGVTANLTINYRVPAMAGQYFVLRATTTKVEGRKAWAEGWIEPLESIDGQPIDKLVEATALFIEPRHAKVMKSLYRLATE